MPIIKVANYSVSLDGFAAGPDQSLDHPMGVGGMALHEWVFPTKMFSAMRKSEDPGETGIDNDFAERSMANLGAWVMGRNMFGPVRGPWPDDSWKGWWGPNPVYHCDVFVLTHYARDPLVMDGGTTFHFITDGLESAVAQARVAAGSKDIRIGGGASTVRAALNARLVDEVYLAISPVFLGRGEPLYHGVDLPALGYRVAEHTRGERATHIVLKREK